MISRFDHCVIATRDLERTGSHFRDVLGVSVYPGGRHTGLGTENAIARFGLDYLEFLGVYDREEVLSAGIKRVSLLDFLAAQQGGLLAYCLAVTDIDGLADQLQRTGLEALGPYSMERRRPDGMLLRWRLLVPGGTAWRRVWPFFIQWEMPDEQRLQIEKPGRHEIDALRVAGATVLVEDLVAAVDLYSRQLSLRLTAMDNLESVKARRATYVVGDFAIHLISPLEAGPVQEAMSDEGAGLYQVEIAVADVDAARRHLALHKCETEPNPFGDGSLLIPPSCAFGTRIGLVQELRTECAL